MREIKFRVWDINLGKMTYSDAYETLSLFFRYYGFMCSNRKVELLQYTGLKDKNGKEIYEGDIVRKRFWNSIWCERTDVIEIPDCYYLTFTGMPEEVFEIIGNIYENSELLQEGKDAKL